MHASLCDTIADVVHNAIEAGASHIELDIETGLETVNVTVTDNGKGMDAEQLRRAQDPFYSEPGKHVGRRVGLGLPLLFQMTEQTGGKAEIRSEPGRGTTVSFRCDRGHLDTPPLGNLPMTLVALMTFPGTYNLALTRRAATAAYAVTRQELSEALGNLEEAGNLTLARHFFESQENELHEEQQPRGDSSRPRAGEPDE